MAQELLDGKDYHEDLLEGLTETIITPKMPERKRMMMDKADAFISLPGGLGTIDELTEVMNEYSCKFHEKPIGLLNTNGFYDKFREWFHHSAEEGFMYHIKAHSFTYEENPVTLVEELIKK